MSSFFVCLFNVCVWVFVCVCVRVVLPRMGDAHVERLCACIMCVCVCVCVCACGSA